MFFSGLFYGLRTDFSQHIVEGLLYFRLRVRRSSWLDLPFPEPAVHHSRDVVVIIVFVVVVPPLY